MEFKLKKRYEENIYRKILGIMRAFRAIKSYDDYWYLPIGMYKSLVQAMQLNLGFDPTDPLYEPTPLHQVLVKGEYNDQEFIEIIRKGQLDPETGILTMDDDTFSLFTQYCEKKGIKYSILQDAEKVDVWEKETIFSLLSDLRKDMESFNYRSVLSSMDLESILRTLNDNQLKIAEKLDVEIKKIYAEIQVKPEETEQVMFRYLSIDPLILYIKDEGITTTQVLRFQDILTLRKDVATELVNMKKGEIIEEKKS